jgi:hypothetical protein
MIPFFSLRNDGATDQESAARIYSPAPLKLIQTGVLYSTRDAEHSPCHRSIAVQDVRVSKLIDDPLVHGAHSIKVGKVRGERDNAHAENT